ncbi:hypothetical protein P4O66_005430, partial [Electrophorus voltai]
SCSRCVVVCSQQVDAGFPWQRFRVVLEFDCVGHSPISSVCADNNINYVSFSTAAPPAGSDPSVMSSRPAYLDSVPFLVFITQGLLMRSDLLQLLESTYNMTLLERSHSLSLQRLGPTHLYDIITVDEGTAILLQGLAELEQDRACERVVMRLSALSLQFTHCWVLLHCTDQHDSLVCGEVFSNLVLIYSAFVVFGLKSEDLDVKVFLMCDIEDIAQYVHQICQHTLLNSKRDVQSWFNRDWFSVLPTEEEKCLLCFPCVNCAVAQLMLNRAPSLQWLLAASLPELEAMFPEIPHKVCKLFSDTTAQHRLSTAPCQSESDTVAPLQTSDVFHPPDYHPHPHPHLPPWLLEGDEPCSASAPPNTHPPPLLTHSPGDCPGAAQPKDAGRSSWFGLDCGDSLGQSGSATASQAWLGDHVQDESCTGPVVVGEQDQWAGEAVPSPGLSCYPLGPPVQLEQGPSVPGKKLPRSAGCRCTGTLLQGGRAPVWAPPPCRHTPPQQQSTGGVCGVGSRGQQRESYSTSPRCRGTERKRPARAYVGNIMQT